jgi:hypothetical protein
LAGLAPMSEAGAKACKPLAPQAVDDRRAIGTRSAGRLDLSAIASRARHSTRAPNGGAPALTRLNHDLPGSGKVKGRPAV